MSRLELMELEASTTCGFVARGWRDWGAGVAAGLRAATRYKVTAIPSRAAAAEAPH